VTASPSPSFLHTGTDPATDSALDSALDPRVDPRSTLRRLSELIRPVTFAREQTMPVLDPLVALLPDGGLTRGSLLQVCGVGATSLALSLMAAGSQDGSWAAVIGLPELGLVAAAEHGLVLDRLALIDAPPTRRGAELVAAVLDGVDLVLLDARMALSGVESRRIAARLRERGSVLIMVEPVCSMSPRPSLSRTSGPRMSTARASTTGASTAGASMSQAAGGWSPDVVFTVAGSQWQGLGEGHGMLRRRRARIDAIGRGRAARPRHLEVLLPADQGSVDVSG
jgi:hypothetical protein